MPQQTDDIVLVKKAQLGDRHSLDRLAETVRVRLHEYVLRLTLNEDLAQDIVQETMLEMLRIFKKLRKAEMFWPWLYGIAINKTRNHYGKQWRRRTRNFSETGYKLESAGGNDTLSDVVTEELKQIVLQSVAQLAPRHRAVLTMRCYDHLSYAQIAKLMDCTEIGARAVFYRAKKCLARKLAAHGLGKGALLVALIAFGKITATSEATAAQVAIAGTTLQVGPMAALLAIATEKTFLIVLATATVTAGTATVNADKIASLFGRRPQPAGAVTVAPLQWHENRPQESWYYFPKGQDGTIMQRLLEFDANQRNPVCHLLQNQYANYHLDGYSHTVHINNYRAWKPDLSVMRLPTDTPELSNFIARMENQPPDMELTDINHNRLLVICNQRGERESRIWRIERHTNVLEEEYFQVSWPESIPVVDDRDTMHKRGWTCFQIDGYLGRHSISGTGRLPFVQAYAYKYYPWLKMRLGDGSTFVDTPTGARIYDSAGLIKAEFPGGSFFQGLLRPWIGLHSIDTIRRDAARQHLPFTTTYDNTTHRTMITVEAEELTLTYTVNMETDVIETLALAQPTEDSDLSGELHLTYLQEISETPDRRFTAPSDIGRSSARQPSPGMLWLEQLTKP